MISFRLFQQQNGVYIYKTVRPDDESKMLNTWLQVLKNIVRFGKGVQCVHLFVSFPWNKFNANSRKTGAC